MRVEVAARCGGAGAAHLGGEGGPDVGVVARDHAVAPLGADGLESPDGLDRLVVAGRRGTGCDLVVEVLLQVGGVEGEDEAVAVGQVDDEALVADGVAVGGDGGEARCQLDVAVGQAPVDAVVVEVAAEHGRRLRGAQRQGGVELALLAVDRCVLGEPAHTAGVVVVEVAEADADHVARVDADVLEGPLDAVAVVADELVLHAHVGEPAPHLHVEQHGRVEAGVEEEPAAVDLQQDARYRLAQAHRRIGAGQRHRRRQVLPAEGERHDAPHARGRRHHTAAGSAARARRCSVSWSEVMRAPCWRYSMAASAPSWAGHVDP